MPSFRRNTRPFTAYLSSLLTRTITEHRPLTYRFLPGRDEALLRFRDADEDGYVLLENGCMLSISQRIGPNLDPGKEHKITTLAYLYALRVSTDIKEPLVRYEYVPQEAASPDYPYPKGHMHIYAAAPDYDALMQQYGSKPLYRIHFPTGRITLEEFIRLLIIEFHVPTHGNEPQKALALLDESQQVFLQEKKTKD